MIVRRRRTPSDAALNETQAFRERRTKAATGRSTNPQQARPRRVSPRHAPGGHTNRDLFDTLPIEDLMNTAVIMASFVYHAAMSDTRTPRFVG